MVFGFALTLIGANQADMARDLSLDLSQTGSLMAALGFGVVFGAPASGPLVDRLPRKPILCFAFFLMGVALLAIDSEMSFARALFHIVVIGVAIGIYSTVLNTVVSESDDTSPTGSIMLLHSAVTVGAMLGPLYVQALSKFGDWTLSFQLIGAAHLALAMACLALRFPAPPSLAGDPAAGDQNSIFESIKVMRSIPTLLLAAVGFSYIGLEAGVMGFSVPYASDALQLDAYRGQWAISAYWLGILLSRLIGFYAQRFFHNELLLVSGILGTAVLLFFTLASRTEIEWMTGMAGLAVGGVYPLVISLAANRFPQRRASTIAAIMSVGSIGGMMVPWITGVIGDTAGIRLAMLSLATWPLIIVVVALVLIRTPKDSSPFAGGST